MDPLLDKLLKSLAAGQPVVFTSLVETRGSTPQKAGARMLVFPDGSQWGTLGGGCVEADVKRQALELLFTKGTTRLATFQLDSDYGWDDGLICGGRMTMLIDPLQPDSVIEFYRQFSTALPAGCTEATLLQDRVGASAGGRWLFDAQGKCVASSPDQPCSAEIREALRPLASRPRPYVAHGVSFIPQLPRVPLYIVGAGHVGQQVAAYAAQVDFDVIVLDDREQYCNRERFPAARDLHVGPIESVLEGLTIPESAFCIIVTRGHQHDEQALFQLIRRPLAYLGMIGSKRKIRLIYDDLQRQGIPPELFEQVHAPLGLSIGSQTVPEIAISIVAELIACRNLGEQER